MQEIKLFPKDDIKPEILHKLKSFVERDIFSVDHYKRISLASVNILRWVKTIYSYAKNKKSPNFNNIVPSIQAPG